MTDTGSIGQTLSSLEHYFVLSAFGFACLFRLLFFSTTSAVMNKVEYRPIG